jgi:hypothetical protein
LQRISCSGDLLFKHGRYHGCDFTFFLENGGDLLIPVLLMFSSSETDWMCNLAALAPLTTGPTHTKWARTWLWPERGIVSLVTAGSAAVRRPSNMAGRGRRKYRCRHTPRSDPGRHAHSHSFPCLLSSSPLVPSS